MCASHQSPGTLDRQAALCGAVDASGGGDDDDLFHNVVLYLFCLLVCRLCKYRAFFVDVISLSINLSLLSLTD